MTYPELLVSLDNINIVKVDNKRHNRWQIKVLDGLGKADLKLFQNKGLFYRPF